MFLNLSILLATDFFARLTYYGSRAVLLLFLVNYVGWPKATAAESYGYFSLIFLFAPLVGGILADFSRKPILCALAGNMMVAAGLFILAYFPYHKFVDNGIFLLAFGAGFQKPGLLINFYHQARSKPRLLDSLFTLLYLAITFGAFVGPGLSALATEGDQWSVYHFAIKLMFVFSLVAPALLIVFYKKLHISYVNDQSETIKASESRRPLLVFTIIASLLFWIVYATVLAFTRDPENGAQPSYGSLVLLGMLLVLVPVNLIRNFKLIYKLAAAMIVLAITAALVAVDSLGAGATIILLATTEALFGPLVLRLVLDNSSSRYAGTSVGVLMIMSYFVNLSVLKISTMDQDLQQEVLWLLIAGLIAIVAILWSLNNARKKELASAEQVLESSRD